MSSEIGNLGFAGPLGLLRAGVLRLGAIAGPLDDPRGGLRRRLQGVDAMQLWKKGFVVWRILSLVVPGKSWAFCSLRKILEIFLENFRPG